MSETQSDRLMLRGATPLIRDRLIERVCGEMITALGIVRSQSQAGRLRPSDLDNVMACLEELTRRMNDRAELMRDLIPPPSEKESLECTLPY